MQMTPLSFKAIYFLLGTFNLFEQYLFINRQRLYRKRKEKNIVLKMNTRKEMRGNELRSATSKIPRSELVYKTKA